jgi:hypothetical protein
MPAEIALYRGRAARIGPRRHCDDGGPLEQNAVAVDEAGIAEDLRIEQCRCHQTVSVTLLRLGGRSGSKPRANDSELTIR